MFLKKPERHYNDKHKTLRKKNGFHKKLFAARGKQAKGRPDLVVDYMSAGKRTGMKLERKLQDPHGGGHQLVVIKPDWTTWPTSSNKLRAGTLLTCSACWRISNDAEWNNPCRGTDSIPRLPRLVRCHPTGGVAWIVKKDFPHRFGDKVQLGRAQFLLLWSCGVALNLSYSQDLQNHQWVACGDPPLPLTELGWTGSGSCQ